MFTTQTLLFIILERLIYCHLLTKTLGTINYQFKIAVSCELRLI